MYWLNFEQLGTIIFACPIGIAMVSLWNNNDILQRNNNEYILVT
jgi:hypothetical protein